jgi:hypothetical protein
VKRAAAFLMLAACLAIGCSDRGAKPVQQPLAPTNAAAAPSTVETAVDGFTGRTAVRAGRQAQEKIRAISADRNADLNEVQDAEK